MDKVWFSGFKYHVNLVCHAQHIFTQLISTQSSVRVSIVTQDFSATNFKIFKRKNRREVFGVSSENILHLTFRSYKKLRTSFTVNYKYRQNFDSTITNSDKSHAKQFLVTAVTSRFYFKFNFSILFPIVNAFISLSKLLNSSFKTLLIIFPCFNKNISSQVSFSVEKM